MTTTLRSALHFTDQVCWSHLRKGRTRELYNARANTIVDILGEAKNPMEVVKKDLLHARAVLEEQGYQPMTIRLYLESFIRVLRAVDEHCKVDRMKEYKGVYPHIPESESRVLTHQESAMLFAAASNAKVFPDSISRTFLKAFITIATLTGCRIGEMIPDKRSQVGALCPDSITEIDDSNGNPMPCLKIKGKKGRFRHVPLVREAVEALEDLRAFQKARGQHQTHVPFFSGWSEKKVRDLVRRAQYHSNIGGCPVTPHTFRRTFATRFMAAGGSLDVLMRLMGHTNLSTTQRYIRTQPHTLADQMVKAFSVPVGAREEAWEAEESED